MGVLIHDDRVPRPAVHEGRDVAYGAGRHEEAGFCLTVRRKRLEVFTVIIARYVIPHPLRHRLTHGLVGLVTVSLLRSMMMGCSCAIDASTDSTRSLSPSDSEDLQLAPVPDAEYGEPSVVGGDERVVVVLADLEVHVGSEGLSPVSRMVT